jgi:hypothetical protein
MEKILPPNPKLKRKKIKALWVHAEPYHWLHEISMFQNCSSPLLAWANTPIINWGYLFGLFPLLKVETFKVITSKGKHEKISVQDAQVLRFAQLWDHHPWFLGGFQSSYISTF